MADDNTAGEGISVEQLEHEVASQLPSVEASSDVELGGREPLTQETSPDSIFDFTQRFKKGIDLTKDER